MSIKLIDRSSVQKICCGQVVIDLTTAVKEVRLQLLYRCIPNVRGVSISVTLT